MRFSGIWRKFYIILLGFILYGFYASITNDFTHNFFFGQGIDLVGKSSLALENEVSPDSFSVREGWSHNFYPWLFSYKNALNREGFFSAFQEDLIRAESC